MKVEIVSEDLIQVFINLFYFKDLNITKSELAAQIKDLIEKIDNRYMLNLNGFYKINAYPNKDLGVFLDIIKIDDNEFSRGADFRIVIYKDERFFLELDNFEDISNLPKRYYDGKFYVDINDIEDINKFIDISKVIYGEDLVKVIMNSKKIFKDQ